MTTSLPVFPNNYPGLAFDVLRTPMWSTRVLTARSGKEFRAADWSFGKYKYKLTYEVLRAAQGFAELQGLMAFINEQQGQFNTFAFDDPDDDQATGQGLGTGDGSTKIFPLLRAYGGYVDPVLCANAINNVYLDGVNQASGWTGIQQGSYGTDAISFTVAPAAGKLVSATFSYYWPCRFTGDESEFNKFAYQFWALKELEFQTVK